MIPRKWMISFATLYIISGITMACCEAYLMSQGLILTIWQQFGPICGFRIGFGIIFIATGIMCLILLKKEKKKWPLLCIALFAIISLASSCILVFGFRYGKSTTLEMMDFGSLLDDYYYYGHNNILENILNLNVRNNDGSLFFPLFPWTFLIILMNVFPYWTAVISAGRIIFIKLLVTLNNKNLRITFICYKFVLKQEHRNTVKLLLVSPSLWEFCEFLVIFLKPILT